MTGYLIKINTTDFTPYLKPSGYKVSRPKLWTDAGRNMAGDLRSNFLGIFPKITLEFIPMTQDEMRPLIAILDNPQLTVEWWDARSDSYKTATYYAGDFENALMDRNREIYDGWTVPLIPFNKYA